MAPQTLHSTVPSANLFERALRQQITNADKLATLLPTTQGLRPPPQSPTWKEVHELILQLQRGVNDSIAQLKVIPPHSLLPTVAAGIRDSITSLHVKVKFVADAESKFKAGEQARNSDYNILISIVKTINEELGIFNKSMM